MSESTDQAARPRHFHELLDLPVVGEGRSGLAHGAAGDDPTRHQELLPHTAVADILLVGGEAGKGSEIVERFAAATGLEQVPRPAEDIGHVAGRHGAAASGLALLGEKDATVAAEDTFHGAVAGLQQSAGLMDDVTRLELEILDAGQGVVACSKPVTKNMSLLLCTGPAKNKTMLVQTCRRSGTRAKSDQRGHCFFKRC